MSSYPAVGNIVLGTSNQYSNNFVLIVGQNNQSSSLNSITAGIENYNNSSERSFLFGRGLVTWDSDQFVIGKFNNYTDEDFTSPKVFIIGGGKNNSERLDLLSVSKASTKINTSTINLGEVGGSDDSYMDSEGNYQYIANNLSTYINSKIYVKGVGGYDGQLRDGVISIWNYPEDLSTALSVHNVTYRKLKQLIAYKQLIPGATYRITDYVTLTKYDTERQSAYHYFDIIVRAKNESTLYPEASADFSSYDHESRTYFKNCDIHKWKLWYDVDNNDYYNWRLGNSDQAYILRRRFPGSSDTDILTLDANQIRTAYGIYKQGTAYIDIVQRNMMNLGIVNYTVNDGYQDKFVLCAVASSLNVTDTPIPVIAYQYTEADYNISIGNSTSTTVNMTISSLRSPNNFQTVKVDKRYTYKVYNEYAGGWEDVYWLRPISGGSASNNLYMYVWTFDDIITNTGSSIETIIELEIIDAGEIISSEFVTGGRGVIYRMIDEFGNDCPYDFKNILTRRITESTIDYTHTTDVTDNNFYYTFTYKDQNNNICDFTTQSINNRCTGNIIKPYTSLTQGKQILPGITFINKYSTNYVFCRDNHIGNNCQNIVFFNGCYFNDVGDSCTRILFRDSCNNNTIVGSCNSIIFEENAIGNTLQKNIKSIYVSAEIVDDYYLVRVKNCYYLSNCGGNSAQYTYKLDASTFKIDKTNIIYRPDNLSSSDKRLISMDLPTV